MTGTRTPARTRLLRWTALAVTSAVALTGCKFQGAASFPLPGGVGGNGYQVAIEFPDVLDLVPQSSVKVNDVTVGSVKKIELMGSGYTARVTVAIKDDVVLPENATAALRQTSLLGEKFVSLDRPANPVGRLRAGMTIPLARTSRNADIEEVLGALSLVLNGGSLEQLQVINSELTKTLKGREGEVRNFLTQLTGFVGGLDAQKTQIVNALDGLDRLAGKLVVQRTTLATALRDIPKGASVLSDERAQLTSVLAALNRLGTVATRVIRSTQQNTVADLRALQPILVQLSKAGQDLPNALELLTTYPFPKTIDTGIRGDYANLYITIDGNINDTVKNLTGSPLPVPLPLGGGTKPVVPGLPSVPGLPTVPKVPSVPGVPRVPAPVLTPLRGVLGGLAVGDRDLAALLFGGLS